MMKLNCFHDKSNVTVIDFSITLTSSIYFLIRWFADRSKIHLMGHEILCIVKNPIRQNKRHFYKQTSFVRVILFSENLTTKHLEIMSGKQLKRCDQQIVAWHLSLMFMAPD